MVKKTFKFENRHVAYEQQVISNIMPDMQRFSEKFKKHTEYAKKETHTEFVKYLNDTIDFDLANGLDLVSNDGSTKWFDFSEAQNDLIFYYDLISIGGRIMMDAFDIEQYARIEGGSNAAVNTANITSYILSELAKIKHEIATAGEQAYVTPYGVNCVLASMIEHELKLHVSRKYILTVLKNVKTALDNSSFCFGNSDDEEYFNDMYSGIVEETPVENGGNDIWMTGKRFYKFLTDYPQFSLSYGIEEKMFKRTLTLNQLVQNSSATADWNPDFVRLMERTFGSANLNLRNNLAHCGYTEYNYHSPFTSFLLNEIFIMIVADFYLN